MPFPDSKTRVRAEPVDLIESRLNTLGNEAFGCVAKTEVREYEDGCDRICQLYC
ncbi:MAG TPA: hypothetical protein VHS34_05915 [Terriglobales bacterium]|jgi:hypothetical protein|nr:hypothetical protein [Terriglobales bacterium]